MHGDAVTVVMAVIAIAVLVILIARFKLSPFMALTLTAIGLGIVAGVTPEHTVDAFTKGFGSALARTGPVVGLGALLGGILIGTGGADRIANAFIGTRPVYYAPWTVCAAALLIGMPHLFDVSFIMLAPLVYTVAKRTGSHLLYIGLPLATGLYVSHGLLPPHPAPMLAVVAYHANTGLTLAYGLLIALPTAVICGPLFTRVMQRYFGPAPDLDAGPVAARDVAGDRAPVSLALSVSSVLIPPGLMLIGTLGMAYSAKGSLAYIPDAQRSDSVASGGGDFRVLRARCAGRLHADRRAENGEQRAGPARRHPADSRRGWRLQADAQCDSSRRDHRASHCGLASQSADSRVGHRGAAARVRRFRDGRDGGRERHRRAAAAIAPGCLA
jgi:GntP family gluconate:H+ symporter